MILRGLVLFCRPVFSYRLGAGGDPPLAERPWLSRSSP